MPNALAQEGAHGSSVLMSRDGVGAERDTSTSITGAGKEIAIFAGPAEQRIEADIEYEAAAHQRRLTPNRASEARAFAAAPAPEFTPLPIGELTVDGIQSGLDRIKARTDGFRQEGADRVRLDHDVRVDVDDPIRCRLLRTQVPGDRESPSLIRNNQRSESLRDRSRAIYRAAIDDNDGTGVGAGQGFETSADHFSAVSRHDNGRYG